MSFQTFNSNNAPPAGYTGTTALPAQPATAPAAPGTTLGAMPGVPGAATTRNAQIGQSAQLQALLKTILETVQRILEENGDGEKAHSYDLSSFMQPVQASAPVTQDEMSQVSPEDQEKLGSQMDTIAVLQRHEDKFGGGKTPDQVLKDLDKDELKNPDKPKQTELRAALEKVKSDPELRGMLDEGKNGERGDKKQNVGDGKISSNDIRAVSKSPLMMQYNEQKAESYTHNYISSDTTDQSTEGREITGNDAMRELYKYSDYLHGNESLSDLQQIVDGTGSEGKRPPQLQAAAKYMVDHPDEWKKLTGKDGNQDIGKADLCNKLAGSIALDPSENKALDTLEKNWSDFGGKKFDRKRLDKIINDPKSKPENVEAAKKLKDDPTLFGMLENAQRGHKGGSWHQADDGNIGHGDVSAFRRKMNKSPAPDPAANKPTTPEAKAQADALKDPSAVRDMLYGQENQPDTKKAKGGALKKFVMGLMKVVSVIEKVASAALSCLADLKIPGISQLAMLGAITTSAIAGGLDVGRTAIAGGNVKMAAMKAGLDVAGTAMSSATGPGAGKGFTKAATANIHSLGSGTTKAATTTSANTTARVASVGAPAASTTTSTAAKNAPRFEGSKLTQSQIYRKVGTKIVTSTITKVGMEVARPYVMPYVPTSPHKAKGQAEVLANQAITPTTPTVPYGSQPTSTTPETTDSNAYATQAPTLGAA